MGIWKGAGIKGGAVTLGAFISLSDTKYDPQANVGVGSGSFTFMHEYGHYLQSQRNGFPTYLSLVFRLYLEQNGRSMTQIKGQKIILIKYNRLLHGILIFIRKDLGNILIQNCLQRVKFIILYGRNILYFLLYQF